MVLRIYRQVHTMTLNPSLAGPLQCWWKRNEMNELAAPLIIMMTVMDLTMHPSLMIQMKVIK